MDIKKIVINKLKIYNINYEIKERDIKIKSFNKSSNYISLEIIGEEVLIKQGDTTYMVGNALEIKPIKNYINKKITMDKLEEFIKIYKLYYGLDKLESFKVNKISLKNYKKYEKLDLTFKTRISLLVGSNGTGKTSVLDGVATLIGGVLQGFKDIPNKITHNIEKKDIRVSYKLDDMLNVQTYLPVEVSGELEARDVIFPVKRRKNKSLGSTLLNKKENKELTSYINGIEDFLKFGQNNAEMIPVFSYHGTGRLWEQNNNKRASKMELLERLDGYNDSLEAKSNYRNFVSWFEKMARYEFSSKKENIALKSIKDIMIRALEQLDEKKIKNLDYREKDIEITYETGEVERVTLLSDGYRNILGIVSDIAYRINILNPNKIDNIKRTPGVVLIDEIDLHLHPKWQKKIVNLLKTLFPKVQFIISSHSPFIIQSMEKNEIIRLDDEKNLTVDGTTMSIEDISEGVMSIKIPQMSIKKQEMLKAAEKYFDILDLLEKGKATEEEVKKSKELLDEISERYESNVAYVAFLKRKRLVTESKLVK